MESGSVPDPVARSPTTPQPPFPEDRPRRFRVTVHGTLFGDRERHLEKIERGAVLDLRPDPPVQKEPQVWVMSPEGPPVGHLPEEVGLWLAPWLQRGGHATARTLRVHTDDVPSFRRLVIEVDCGA